MATAPMADVFRQFSRLFAAGTSVGMSEGQLVERYLKARDEAAFAALVERFGPMVLGVCRKFLPDAHAAEDAFQATFLVLVRRAGTIRDRDLVGHWLYAVALKVVKRSRADLARLRAREKGGEDVDLHHGAGESGPAPFDFAPLLHEELARLPENYRKPLVLCFLDGRTHEEAAGLLRWPVGTVKGRIARGKDLLRDRLTRRGVAISSAAIAAALAETTAGAVPPLLLDTTIKAATGVAAGGVIAAGAYSVEAVALAEGVMATMSLTKIKILAGAVVALGTVATGAAVMAQLGNPPGTPNPGVQAVQKPDEPQKAAPPNAEAKAPALPASNPMVKAQMTAIRLNQLRVDVARRKLAKERQLYERGATSLGAVCDAAREVMQAFRGSAAPPSYYLKDAEMLLELARKVEAGERQKEVQGAAPLGSAAEAEILTLEADLWFEQAKRGIPVPGMGLGGMGGPVGMGGGMGVMGGMRAGGGMLNPSATMPGFEEPESDDPDRDKQIHEILNKAISMPFAAETPLEEIIKYIKTATTTDAMPQGLPIYIDPVGLQEAEKTMKSTITFNMEGVKLKTTLRITLKQLDLGYYVHDGMLTITALNNEDFPLWAFPPGERRQRASERIGGFQ